MDRDRHLSSADRYRGKREHLSGSEKRKAAAKKEKKTQEVLAKSRRMIDFFTAPSKQSKAKSDVATTSHSLNDDTASRCASPLQEDDLVSADDCNNMVTEDAPATSTEESTEALEHLSDNICESFNLEKDIVMWDLENPLHRQNALEYLYSLSNDEENSDEEPDNDANEEMDILESIDFSTSNTPSTSGRITHKPPSPTNQFLNSPSPGVLTMLEEIDEVNGRPIMISRKIAVQLVFIVCVIVIFTTDYSNFLAQLLDGNRTEPGSSRNRKPNNPGYGELKTEIDIDADIEDEKIAIGSVTSRAQIIKTIKNACLPKLICELNASFDKDKLTDSEKSLLSLIRDTSLTTTMELTKYHFAAHMGQLISGVDGNGCHNFYPTCPFPGLQVLKMMKKVRLR
ncbi:hypothetical protein RN001_016122 [Aquatica leii]|uniref:Uncharacterized protein n=1 Tax=Aquatica leii TaxID=1421715 RepID=A0AAN7QB41_9COLE|nr:hypothetical protein RN001_016122 [Aquatica leii]